MSTLANLVVKLTGDDSSLNKVTRSAVKSLVGLGKTAGKLTAGAGVLGGALAGAAVAGATVLAKQSAESIDATRKLATNLGVTANQAAALARTFDNTGIGADNGAKAFQRMRRSLSATNLESKAGQRALAAMGLSAEDLAGKLPFEQFQIVTAALGKITDANLRAEAGNQLLGRQWQTFDVLLKDNQKTLNESIKMFDGLGLGLGSSGGEVESMNDAIADLVRIGAALRDKVFAALAPQLESLAVAAKQFVLQLVEAVGGGDALAKLVVDQLIGGFKSLMNFMGGVARVGQVVARVFSTVANVFAWVGEIVGGVVAAVVQLVQGNFSGAAAIVGGLADVSFGGSGEESEETNRELRKQTEMLARIADNTFGAVLQ